MLNLNCTSDNNEKKNKALKLHHQFVHHNYKKIVDLLKDPEVNDKELEEELKKVDESCEKLRRAMQHNIITSQDTKYYSGDLVYYKQKDNNYWKGPGTVIGQDGQQVLVKHSSSYVRVHPCQLQLINNMKENELERRESMLKEQ